MSLPTLGRRRFRPPLSYAEGPGVRFPPPTAPPGTN
jgi:hypothetical protein